MKIYTYDGFSVHFAWRGFSGNRLDTWFHPCSENIEKRYVINPIKGVKLMPDYSKRPEAGVPPGGDIPPEDKSPFLVKKVTCPICKFKSEQRRFKLKIYAEKNVDIDKHVQLYAWIDKDFQNYHPPLYYFWHCPNCYFTESYQDFEEPGKPIWSTFRLLKDDFTQKFQEDQKVEKLVTWLSKGIDYDSMNFTQSVRLHLLAIFIQMILSEEKDVDTLKVGRYYVRTGWLLREMKEMKSKELGTVKSILAEVKKLWPEVPVSRLLFTPPLMPVMGGATS